MAFPITRSAFAGIKGTNATSWTLTYPGGGDILDGGGSAVVSGDLILINISRDGTTGTPSITGYSLIFNQVSGGNAGYTFVKVADGTESGTFTLSAGASEQGVWRIAVIKDWWGTISGGVEVSSAATGTGTAPNPPSFTPSWGAADTYWRAVAATDDGRTGFTAYPSSPDVFNLYQNSDPSNGSGGASLGSAGLTKNAATVDAGTFTINRSVTWVSWIVAVRPAVSLTGQIKVWNGSQWVAKPVKYYNGTQWQTKPLSYYNGTQWVVTPY